MDGISTVSIPKPPMAILSPNFRIAYLYAREYHQAIELISMVAPNQPDLKSIEAFGSLFPTSL